MGSVNLRVRTIAEDRSGPATQQISIVQSTQQDRKRNIQLNNERTKKFIFVSAMTRDLSLSFRRLTNRRAFTRTGSFQRDSQKAQFVWDSVSLQLSGQRKGPVWVHQDRDR
jgi:hypothetical protein